MVEKVTMGETTLAEPRVDKAASGLGVIAGLAAVAAATCCVLPIALTVLGLGGGWLTVLGYVTGIRGYVLAAGCLILVGAVLLAWHRPGRQRVGKGTAATFALTALLLVAAATAPLWERPATEFLWNIWVRQ